MLISFVSPASIVLGDTGGTLQLSLSHIATPEGEFTVKGRLHDYSSGAQNGEGVVEATVSDVVEHEDPYTGLTFESFTAALSKSELAGDAEPGLYYLMLWIDAEETEQQLVAPRILVVVVTNPAGAAEEEEP